MRAAKPSITARRVALMRAGFVRPVVPTGDAGAEARLYRTLGGSWLAGGESEFRSRMERRTAFYDREMLGALRRGVGQVVIIAAGYDGRALRFASPGVAFFEVDHPSTQADKRARLAAIGVAPAHLAFVPVDLTTDDLVAGLAGAGHDPDASTLFVVEGLLGYLPRPVTERLLSDLAVLSGPGSRLAVAFPIEPDGATASERRRHRARGLVVAAIGEPWVTRFGPDEPQRVLAAAGWETAVDDGAPVLHRGRIGVLVAAVPQG